MFASPQNIPQNQNVSDPLAYPTGSSLQPVTQTAQALVPVPPMPTSIPTPAATVPLVPPVTPSVPIVMEPIPVVAPLIPPQPVVANTVAESRRNELEALIQKQDSTPVPQPTTAPMPEVAAPTPQQTNVPTPTAEVPVPQPVISMEQTVPTQSYVPAPSNIPVVPPVYAQEAVPSFNQGSSSDTIKRLWELEQRILKLEQTIGQWV